MGKVTERYFYTRDTPHEWSSGPSVNCTDLERGGWIESIDRARELAEQNAKGTPGYSGWVKTSYGILFEEEWDDEQDSS